MSRHEQGESNVTGGKVAASELQTRAIAIVNVERVIARRSYHFVIAVERAKEAERSPRVPKRQQNRTEKLAELVITYKSAYANVEARDFL
jgi:hypothetical protein